MHRGQRPWRREHSLPCPAALIMVATLFAMGTIGPDTGPDALWWRLFFQAAPARPLTLPVQRNTSSWGYPTRLGSRRA
jgi:hypothetical protein